MVSEKYLSFDINDERTGKIAEVLANKTCKKILNLLAEEELSAGDISKRLKIAANTLEYNLKNLVDSGLVEKSQKFFWSVKGKRIVLYKVANKKIIISPKSKVSGILTSVLAGGLLVGGMKVFVNYLAGKTVYNSGFQTNFVQKSMDFVETSSGLSSVSAPSAPLFFSNNLSLFSGVGFWIILGLILGLAGFFVYSKLKGGKV
jgi:DNA-binding transcriptional ArsR family regulator